MPGHPLRSARGVFSDKRATMAAHIGGWEKKINPKQKSGKRIASGSLPTKGDAKHISYTFKLRGIVSGAKARGISLRLQISHSKPLLDAEKDQRTEVEESQGIKRGGTESPSNQRLFLHGTECTPGGRITGKLVEEAAKGATKGKREKEDCLQRAFV